ncbi:MAG: hypothetical protein JJE18_01960 [Eubacteriaceae bacterium]|nr:hypothetical protein [Eubacteriaceae bacterium]
MKRKYRLTGILVLATILIFCGSLFGKVLAAVGTEAPDDSFIGKLGTFLFITAVLMFLLQWRRNKRK